MSHCRPSFLILRHCCAGQPVLGPIAEAKTDRQGEKEREREKKPFLLRTFDVLGDVPRFSLHLPQDSHDLLVLDLLLHDITLVACNLSLDVELLLLLLTDGRLDGSQRLITPVSRGSCQMQTKMITSV